ncbi:SDR family NAD(P)-dependent oxidoreductase [Aspergillus stella-maris]|uniref:SDR family NAD(P)-dependent oxidoreductase n=1 Tax=Aspergillus stella-maris TaxID=1810926 RepID=UPI003CCE47C5
MSEPDHTGTYFTAKRHTDTYPTIDPSKKDLTGKYVFITGASKGIGRATALAYARAGCAGIGIGARTDLSEVSSAIAQAATDAGRPAPQVTTVSLDVTDRASVFAAAETIASSFPRLDILINNAGYLEIRAPIAETDPDEWLKTWTVNTTGVYLITRAFLPQILDPNRPGLRTIVNLSSIGAHLIAPGASAYQTSKLAVLRFTEFLNADHAKDGLVAYAVHPGGVLTDMGRRLPTDRHAFLTETPELCADSLVFLTETRREWLAGRYISVTWDMEELLEREEEIVSGDKLRVRMVI